MTDYVVGDIQGCFNALMRLFDRIEFDTARDRLWCTGDLVNRGPDSLAVLRFIKSLPHSVVVLGNHDLYLLARIYGYGRIELPDQLQNILTAPDRDELADWLRQRPLLYSEAHHVLVHAGLPPQWDLQQAQTYAQEVELILRGDHYQQLFAHMYEPIPEIWDEQLHGWERINLILYYFTQLRLCTRQGRIERTHKAGLNQLPNNYLPWFKIPERRSAAYKILFGHWAALLGDTNNTPNVYALDTGCVWGNHLTAMRLTDHKRISVSCV